MVRLFVGQIMVEESPCWAPEGTWQADWYGTFVASFDAASACPTGPAFRLDRSLSGPEWAGEVVGRLVPEEVAPPAHLALAVEIMEAQFGVPDEQERAEWAPAAPLRPGLVAVTRENLAGRWLRISVVELPGGRGIWEVNRAEVPFEESPGFEVAASGEWTG